MKNTAFFKLLLLTLTLALPVEATWAKDPHWDEREKLIIQIEEIQREAESFIEWSCDPQYQHRLHKIHDQWIPYPPPGSEFKNSVFWHDEFKRLSGYYSDLDCFDIAIELVESALKYGKHTIERDLDWTRDRLEALKYNKRNKKYSSTNPKHPHYDDPDYDPSDEPLPFEE